MNCLKCDWPLEPNQVEWFCAACDPIEEVVWSVASSHPGVAYREAEDARNLLSAFM